MKTSQAEVIKKCRNDLQKERIIKSVLCGMAVGFGVTFVIAFITWIFEFKGLWLSLGLGFAAWAGAAVVFYFVIFKLTDMQVMQRLDRTGLDERMVTMYQLRDDDSYMAQRQRDDATSVFAAAVKKSGGRLIKTKITTAIVCATCIACSFGTGMAVVTALSDYGVIPTLYDLCSGEGLGFGHGATTPIYTVTYQVGGDKDGGTIRISSDTDNTDDPNNADGSDKAVDRVQKGGSSSAKAEYAQGYYIEKWIDEKGVEYYPDPYGAGYQPTVFSQDNIQKNMTVTVVFAKLDEADESAFGYYYDPDSKGNGDGNGNEDGFGDEDGDGYGDDGKGEPEPNLGDEQPPTPPGNGPGGGNPATEGNAIVDGTTQYGENYDYYYSLAMDMLANGTEGYPPELVAMLEAYFGILK